MTKLEKMQADFRAIEAKAKPLHEKEELTEVEGTELNGYLDQMEALKAKMEQENRAQAAFSIPAESNRIEIHDDADEASYSFGEFLQDVAFAGRTMEKKPRLIRHQQRNAEIIRKEFRGSTGMNEALPAEGGFLVGTDFAPGLITKVYDNSQIARLCQRMTISGPSNGIKKNGIDETSRATGSRWGGVCGYWIGEGADLTGSKPKFRQIELLLKKLAVLYYATDELLQDTMALEQDATTCVQGEMDFMLQDSLINGTGAGKPLGVLNAPALVSVDGETGQTADTIVLENISNMWARMWAPSRASSVWLINQEIEPQLDVLSIPVGTGGMPVYMPPGGLADSPYGRMKGRPVMAIEQASALGDKGDIMLMDFGQYQLVDKGGVQSAASMHVQFTTDEMVYRFILRVDGQPLWHSALTPFKATSGKTLSPFVALAAR